MRGGNILALLLVLLALVLLWLAVSGNYHATFAALRNRYIGGSSLLTNPGNTTKGP